MMHHTRAVRRSLFTLRPQPVASMPLPSLLRRTALPAMATLLLGACDRDPGEVVREISAARGECDEAALRAGTEECVRMFERFAEMGTEAMQTYIGAVRSLDQALRRMPPTAFDTTGLGHAITPAPQQGGPPPDWQRIPGEAPNYGESASASPNFPEGHGRGYGRPPAEWGSGTAFPYDPRDGRSYPVDPYDAGYRDGYSAPPGGYEEREGWTADPRGGGAPEHRRRPASRGLLLPPEQRLRRPWLSEDEYHGPYPASEYEPEAGYPADPRWTDTLPPPPRRHRP